MAHRLQTRASLPDAHRSTLCLRSAIVRHRALALTQARTLWWWGRQTSDWSPPSFDENLEERVRRHERMLRHRWNKMLRRRAMWEKDTPSKPTWPWPMSRRWIQNAPSTGPSRSEPEEHRTLPKDRDQPMSSFNRDFESFKAAVDKAIDKDTYGALFGQRLQGPASVNNSSWTSFSWIWDPSPLKQDHPASTTVSSVHTSDDAPSPNKSKPSPQPIPSAQSVAQDEYEYDPISMRKVWKAHTDPAGSTQKSIFDSLFSEHGVDIPIKTYKPHKVHGYGASQLKDSRQPPEADTLPSANNRFESNRQREFQALKASTLGNTIDTSPEFFGKVTESEPVQPSTASERWTARSQEPADDTTLFSGTTYEAKSEELLASRKPKSNWLLDEGFRSTTSQETFEIPVQKSHSKLQPSLDRTCMEKASSSIIQPALDRHLETAGPHATRAVKTAPDEKADDVDLLRPHMVRANAKTVRTTKQDTEQLKQEARSKLETDFATREANKEAELKTPSWKFSGRLGPIESKHVLDHPNGVVAKTLRMVNDSFKKQDSESSIGAIVKSPKTPPQPVTTFTPSNDVLRMDGQLHPLKTATVKEGVPRYPAIEAHVSTFEPKFAKLVDEAKRIRRVMHEAQLHYRSLKDRLERSPWPEVQAASPAQSFAMLKEDPIEEDYPQGLDGPFPAPVSRPEQKVQEPVFTPDGSATWNDEQPPPVYELLDFRSQSHPYVLLRYKHKRRAVQVVPLSQPPPDTTNLESFSRLDNAAKFLTYFPGLLKEGYEMVSGGEDFVLFKRSKEASRPSVKMEEIAKESPLPTKGSAPVASKLLKPATSPRMAARLKEEQDLISSFIKVGDVKHTHGLNSFEVHSVLSQLAAQVDAGQQEGAKGLKGILFKLKALRSKALFMNPAEFNKQAEALINEVQLARSAQPIKEVTPSAPVATSIPEPSEAQKMEAATVLDDIPQPTPGPAAPTAPPSTPISRPTITQQPAAKQVPPVQPEPMIKQERAIPQEAFTEQEPPKRQQPLSEAGEGPKARIRRQENGFSGTMKSPPYRPLAASSSSTSSSPSIVRPRSTPVSQSESEPEPEPEIFSEPAPPEEILPPPHTAPRLGAFKRFTRLVKRTILTILGAGVGAYVIGVVAEGIGAEQQKLGHDGDGPRRKVVLPPSTPSPGYTRPGIYSTESSR